MEKIRRFLIIPLLFLFAIALFSCGDDNSNDKVEYVLSFDSNGGTTVSEIKKEENSSISKPNDPEKADNIFDGWFYDNNFTDPVTWPIILIQNDKVYAKWTENRAYFLKARDETVNSDQFEYDFNLNVTTMFVSIAGPTAITTGNVKYNSSSPTTYLKTETNSGALRADGTIYTSKAGTELSTIKINPQGKASGYSKETVSSDFKYESSSFAKALFTFSKDQITTVTKVSGNKYEIKFTGGASGIMSGALSALNSSIVQRFINVPENDSNFHVYVTFKDGKIDKFEYEFTVSALASTLTFHYDLTFKKIGSGVSIDPPDFPNLILSSTGVNNELTAIKTLLTSYRNLQNSGYTYEVKTDIDFPGKLEINSTAQGRTMRLVDNGDVYFWNRVEFDSDYKNADLYKNYGVVDYERYRVTYADGSVYQVEDRPILSNIYTKLDSYANSAVDNYYMLLPNTFFTTNNISLIEKVVSGTKTVYSLGLTNAGILELLQFVDLHVRVDLNEANEIVIYDVNTGMEIKASSFDITIENNKLSKIDIDVKGTYDANPYVGTEFTGPCTFRVRLKVEVNNKGDNYVAPTKNSEVDLSNS